MATFNFAALKAETRRVVHDILGVDATYQDNTMNAPVSIKARLKAKNDLIGDLGDQGYAQVLEAVDRIVLIPSDYPTVTFRQGGEVVFTDYGITVILEAMEPKTGPLTDTWRVSRA